MASRRDMRKGGPLSDSFLICGSEDEVCAGGSPLLRCMSGLVAEFGEWS